MAVCSLSLKYLVGVVFKMSTVENFATPPKCSSQMQAESKRLFSHIVEKCSIPDPVKIFHF